ncbi:MAG: DegT/DnrJ/EryC1/StrS family aminotransferase [Candidatus Saganbacteria bacterium]|nr:DegT/DnrJ/EryC1/StrS family aminotransferase [Candidatus Saganbacteria bacterium]
MAVPFFDITRQNRSFQPQLDQVIKASVDSGRYILGQTVADFEQAAAGFCGTKHAIGVASGTDALHLALRACGIGPGDEVITTAFTFVATIEAIIYCGAKPVFADIEPKTFNIEPRSVTSIINKKTKAILPVSLYGQTPDMQNLLSICDKRGLRLVEDACQAIGAEQNGTKSGAFGDAGCFSFFPTKNLGCFGDGGLITTNNGNLADECRVLRGHGSREMYKYEMIGYNSRLDALQAAILHVKLPKLDDFSHNRRINAEFYRKNLVNIAEISLPTEAKGCKHVYNQFTLRVKERDKLVAHLRSKNIGSMVYYPLALHLHQAYSYLGFKKGDLPETEKAQTEVMSLPIFPELTESELAEVVSAIKEFYKK